MLEMGMRVSEQTYKSGNCTFAGGDTSHVQRLPGVTFARNLILAPSRSRDVVADLKDIV